MHPFAQFIHQVYTDLFGDHTPTSATKASPQQLQTINQAAGFHPFNPIATHTPQAPIQNTLQQINAATGFRAPQMTPQMPVQPALNAINQSTGFNPYVPQSFNPQPAINAINRATGR